MADDIIDYDRNPERSIFNIARLVYLLHALSIVIGLFTGASVVTAFLFGWPSIAAVVLNYVMRSDAKGTYIESHFTWQIRTFWYAALWTVAIGILGVVLSFVLIGFGIWFYGFIIMGIWVAYRIIRGWLRLADGRPMPI